MPALPAAPGNVTPSTFAVGVLRGLGAPITPQNVQALVGWQAAEGGNWHNSATYNPLNTTQAPATGAYSNTGTQGNIKAYSSWQQGLAATLQTLQNGRYGGILSALKAGNNANAVANAIGASPWGTSGSLVSQAIAGASGQVPQGPGLTAAPPSVGSGVRSALGGRPAPNPFAAPQAQAQQQKDYQLGQILRNMPNPYGGPNLGRQLTGLGVLPSAPPAAAPSTNTYAAAQNSMQQLAGSTGLQAHPSLVTPGAKGSGYVNPIPGATFGRTDQGVDINLPVGHPILAIGDSKVIGISPNWYAGQPYVLFQLINGPKAGSYYYVAEQFSPTVKPGQTVRAGQTIGTYAQSGTGIEIGWGSPHDGETLAKSTTGYTEGQVTPAGTSFRNFLGGL